MNGLFVFFFLSPIFLSLSLSLCLIISQDGDRGSLYNVARALMKMQIAFGCVPIIRGVR